MERQIWVDFNAVDESGHVDTLARFAADGANLDIGSRLIAGDDEGNKCEAEVLDVADGLVRLALNLGTMRGEPSAESLAGHGAQVRP